MAPEELTPALSDLCTRVRPLLSSYVDGEANVQERGEVETHVGCCEACASHLAFLKVLTKALPAPPVAALPPGLSARIAAGTYARPSLWERLLAALRPAPARYALGGAFATALVFALVVPRIERPIPVERPTPSTLASPAVPQPLASPTPEAPQAPQGKPKATVAPVTVAKADFTPKAPVKLAVSAPTLATPTDHHTEKVIVVPASATPAPPSLSEREAPKGASTELVATNGGSVAGPTESLPTPAPIRTATLGARLQNTASMGLVEQGGDEPTEGNIKVSLNVTSKQMKDAVGKISSLSANSGEHFTTSNRLTIADAPATIR
jgi:anti-sigma factor RsiW